MESDTPISKDDLPAILAIFGRYVALYLSDTRDEAELKKIEARRAANKEQFARLHTAFNVFGLNTRKDGGGFRRIREAIGVPAYLEAMNRARVSLGLAPAPNMQAAVELEPTQDAETTSAESDVSIEADASSGDTVRDMILESLKSAGEAGQKAAEIQAKIEARRGAKLHPKTTGMTLYRLSQEGAVRREGRTWFYVPQSAETKNPGVGAPGQT